MKHEFIQINQSVLDYSEYIKNVLLLKHYLVSKIAEIILLENFQLAKRENSTYSHSTLTFYNAKKDLEVTISIRKRKQEIFV
jgi:hypothetical protein